MTKAVVTATLVIALVSGTALATHVEPAKANKATFTLVNGFSECDPSSPNTAMQSNGTPACTPPVKNGLGPCAFGSGGSGTLTIAKIGSVSDGTQDLKIAASAKGLDPSCLSLHVLLSYRLTSDDCPEGSCTAVDQTADLIGVECTVTNGKCKIRTTLNSAAPGTIPNGKNAGIDILGCGLRKALPIVPRVRGRAALRRAAEVELSDRRGPYEPRIFALGISVNGLPTQPDGPGTVELR